MKKVGNIILIQNFITLIGDIKNLANNLKFFVKSEKENVLNFWTK